MWWEGGKEPVCEQEQLKFMLISVWTLTAPLSEHAPSFFVQKKVCLLPGSKQSERGLQHSLVSSHRQCRVSGPCCVAAQQKHKGAGAA